MHKTKAQIARFRRRLMCKFIPISWQAKGQQYRFWLAEWIVDKNNPTLVKYWCPSNLTGFSDASQEAWGAGDSPDGLVLLVHY